MANIFTKSFLLLCDCSLDSQQLCIHAQSWLTWVRLLIYLNTGRISKVAFTKLSQVRWQCYARQTEISLILVSFFQKKNIALYYFDILINRWDMKYFIFCCLHIYSVWLIIQNNHNSCKLENVGETCENGMCFVHIFNGGFY